MSILTMVVIAACVLALLKVGSLLFDPPALKQLTLSELEREMSALAQEWTTSLEVREASDQVHQELKN